MTRSKGVDGHTDGDHLPFNTAPSFDVTFPQGSEDDNIQQDAETVDVVVKQRIRIHDYETLYSYPNLYDHIIEDKLKCKSPQQLVAMLKQQPQASNPARGPISILDVAAGNGRVAVELRKHLSHMPGIERLVGTDLFESARVAACRDREPDLYDEYVVADLINPSHPTVTQWAKNPFDVATICAALGPGEGDMPLEVIDAVIHFLKINGLLALTVNHGLQERGSDRYRRFLSSLGRDVETHWKGMVRVDSQIYKHRLSVKGEWIDYTALVYRKVDTVGC